MKEWLWHLKVEIMDVMAASANICLLCIRWENYMGSPNYIVHCSLVPLFLAKLMLFLFSFDLTLCFNYLYIGLGLGYMSNEAQWKTKINSQTWFHICNDLEVPLYDIVIVPYVSQYSSNSKFKSLGLQKVLGVQQLQMKLLGKAIAGITFIMNNPIVCLAYCAFPYIYKKSKTKMMWKLVAQICLGCNVTWQKWTCS